MMHDSTPPQNAALFHTEEKGGRGRQNPPPPLFLYTEDLKTLWKKKDIAEMNTTFCRGRRVAFSGHFCIKVIYCM